MRFALRMFAAFIIAILVTSVAPSKAQSDMPPSSLPAVATLAPDFTLLDANTGKKRSLREFARAKRPVGLFFFCGCPACHAVAQEWAKYQRGNALPTNAATVIVYSTTDRNEAKVRIAASGLDPKRTAVLCDTESLNVTERLYHAEPCPRLVIVNSAGKIVYANTGADEKPQEAPAELLVARALSVLLNPTL